MVTNQTMGASHLLNITYVAKVLMIFFNKIGLHSVAYKVFNYMYYSFFCCTNMYILQQHTYITELLCWRCPVTQVRLQRLTFYVFRISASSLCSTLYVLFLWSLCCKTRSNIFSDKLLVHAYMFSNVVLSYNIYAMLITLLYFQLSFHNICSISADFFTWLPAAVVL